MNIKELLENKKLLAIIAGVLVLVLVLCLVLGGGGAEKAATNYIKNCQKEKPEKLYSSLPKDIRNYIEDDMDEDDFMDLLEDRCDSFNDSYDDCKFKVLEVGKMSEDSLDYYEDMVENLSDEIDEDLKLQSAKVVIIKVTDEDGGIGAITYSSLKINGTWVCSGLLTRACSYLGVEY